MKFLKALLAIFTFLAVALTGVLLFVQDKSAPRYIQIYTHNTHSKSPGAASAVPGLFDLRF